MVFRFADLWALQLLWFIPFMIFLSLALGKYYRRRLVRNFGKKALSLLTASISISRRNLKLFLQVLVVVFMSLALARPQSGETRQKVVSEGIELMILFDVSRSMLAEDVRPSRLEFAKKEMMKFLDLNTGHKIGLVAFAGSGLLLSPMTTDKSALKMFLGSLTVDSVSTQGTEFRGALRSAGEAFKRGGSLGDEEKGEEGDEKKVVTRAIVIVSDGEDHEKGALVEAEKLLKEGVRIFSLGFGTKKGGAIPVRDRMGYLRGYYKDKKGRVILTQTKGTILRELAQKGRGSFRHVTYGGTAIKDLYEDLKKLEQSEFNSMDVRKYDEKYQWFLGLALLLALLEILLGERRSRGRIWKGRFEVAKP